MKKIIFTLLLASSTVVFAKTADPIKQKEDSFLKTEKTTKENFNRVKTEKIVLKKSLSPSGECFLIAAVVSSLGLPANWGHCINLFEAGF